ncbi:MAG: hypothetical protein IJB76_00985, partial [Clostridia bacterium]|nr:hypothetical protein [Clostridia bacterium]
FKAQTKNKLTAGVLSAVFFNVRLPLLYTSSVLYSGFTVGIYFVALAQKSRSRKWAGFHFFTLHFSLSFYLYIAICVEI